MEGGHKKKKNYFWIYLVVFILIIISIIVVRDLTHTPNKEYFKESFNISNNSNFQESIQEDSPKQETYGNIFCYYKNEYGICNYVQLSKSTPNMECPDTYNDYFLYGSRTLCELGDSNLSRGESNSEIPNTEIEDNNSNLENYCGNNICGSYIQNGITIFETYLSCPQDCLNPIGDSCDISDEFSLAYCYSCGSQIVDGCRCIHNICRESENKLTFCGDGFCDNLVGNSYITYENSVNCPQDCLNPGIVCDENRDAFNCVHGYYSLNYAICGDSYCDRGSNTYGLTNFGYESYWKCSADCNLEKIDCSCKYTDDCNSLLNKNECGVVYLTQILYLNEDLNIPKEKTFDCQNINVNTNNFNVNLSRIINCDGMDNY